MPVSRHTSIQTNTPPHIDIRPTGRGDLAGSARGLTARDATVVSYLAQHRVLTALQIARLVFGSYSHARARLVALHGRGVLARFRRRIWPGSQPWRYALGPVGAAVHAAATGQPAPRAATVSDALWRLAYAPATEHLLGVNDFFATLAGYARTRDDCQLQQWWPETETRAACGDLVRPDAYGEWSQADRSIGFFYEHDTGTETLDVLVNKVAKYAELAEAGIERPVLFRLPSTAREQNLRQALARRWPGHIPVPIVTMAADQLGPASYDLAPASPCAAEAVWLPAGRHERFRLADLPAAVRARGQTTGPDVA